MTRAVTLLTDASADADTLAGWMVAKAPHVGRVTALGPHDVEVVIRQRADLDERLLVLVDGLTGHAPAVAALAAVRAWFEGLGPFERRTDGPERIDEALREGRPGAHAVRALLRTVQPSEPVVATRRRGRPRGGDPFHGAGFDTCVGLLLSPDRQWSERALADYVRRSSYAVHRTLAELDRRGYLERERGATSVARPRALLEDLARGWRDRAAARTAVGMVARDPAGLVEHIATVAEAHALVALRAGPSATTGPTRLMGGALRIYGEDGLVDALRDGGLVVVDVASADVVVLTPTERAVLLEPAPLDALRATNRVVTYLDLSEAEDDRYRAAADATWADS